MESKSGVQKMSIKQSISEIYDKLERKFHSICCFRVRDIINFNDYLICNYNQWTWNGTRIISVWGLLLAPKFKSNFSLKSNEVAYTLLSSDAELSYFREIGQKLAINLLESTYMKYRQM